MPTQISVWKSLALKNLCNVFSSDPAEKKDDGVDSQILHTQIGQLKFQNDWQKKLQ